MTRMNAINIHEAKSSLSRLVQRVEAGHEREIIISRNGRPAAKLVALDHASPAQRLGIAKGKFCVPDEIDAHNAEVATLFMGECAG